MIQILHNPRCGKSRNCLAFLNDSKKEFEIIKYLENRPTFDELALILKKLDYNPIELVRQNETIWIENYKKIPLTNDEIIMAMIENPILIERPIIIIGNKAFVVRDLATFNSDYLE